MYNNYSFCTIVNSNCSFCTMKKATMNMKDIMGTNAVFTTGVITG